MLEKRMKTKKIKKWLLFLLTGALLAAPGCGEKDSQQGAETVNTQQQTQPSTEAETPFAYPNTDLSNLEVEVLDKGVVFREASQSFAYCAWPTVALTDQGEAIVTFSGQRAGHIDPFGATLLCRASLTDLKFSAPVVINDTKLDDRDSGILYLGNGRMLATFFTHSAEYYENDKRNSILNGVRNKLDYRKVQQALDGYANLTDEEREGGSYYLISNDYGVTWSEPKKINITSPHGPTLLASGDLIWVGKGHYSSDSPSMVAYISRDSGETWRRIGILSIPEGLVSGNIAEAHTIEMPDGTLLCAARGQSLDPDVWGSDLSVFFYRSTDGGKTWSDPVWSGFEGAPPHLTLTKEGLLVCSIGIRNRPGVGVAIHVSSDGGYTWTEKEYIALSSSFIDDPTKNVSVIDVGYPATVLLEDGSFLTVFYTPVGSDNVPSIVYVKWKMKL